MLTRKQEAFCLAMLEAPNASAAYRSVYASDKMKPETVNRMAFDLLQDRKIAARIEELRAQAAEKAVYSLADHMARLKALSEKAEKEGQLGPAVKAEELRGRVSGFYVEKTEHSNPDGTLRPTVIQIVAKPAEKPA